jgi:hypothetical protein
MLDTKRDLIIFQKKGKGGDQAATDLTYHKVEEVKENKSLGFNIFVI